MFEKSHKDVMKLAESLSEEDQETQFANYAPDFNNQK